MLNRPLWSLKHNYNRPLWSLEHDYNILTNKLANFLRQIFMQNFWGSGAVQELWKNLLCPAVGLLVPDSLREQKSVKSAVKRGQGPPAGQPSNRIKNN